MTTNQLRAIQAPLKEQYQQQPEAALLTLRAEGTVGNKVSCNVSTARALVEAGLHPATGGTGNQACSGDMLLEALVACAGVTLKAVATAMTIAIDYGVVRAEGDLDFRGTLGVANEAPVGFQAIRLTFELDTDASPEQIETLVSLTKQYCVIYQTLQQPPALALCIETLSAS
ncbi:OsmC family protein [Fibrivirga algicola]|uniref:OsmC family protein n=1 Tax=Fibrivirga algicola TaxID=2950420 RepID=A0ABX0QF37_9BACT|nr:OsmC family protein [Fibrivirga algicola]NID09712.1 OsmC family protein [Fibrivirga algicola]